MENCIWAHVHFVQLNKHAITKVILEGPKTNFDVLSKNIEDFATSHGAKILSARLLIKNCIEGPHTQGATCGFCNRDFTKFHLQYAVEKGLRHLMTYGDSHTTSAGGFTFGDVRTTIVEHKIYTSDVLIYVSTAKATTTEETGFSFGSESSSNEPKSVTFGDTTVPLQKKRKQIDTDE